MYLCYQYTALSSLPWDLVSLSLKLGNFVKASSELGCDWPAELDRIGKVEDLSKDETRLRRNLFS
jgi:hypothetical protein